MAILTVYFLKFPNAETADSHFITLEILRSKFD